MGTFCITPAESLAPHTTQNSILFTPRKMSSSVKLTLTVPDGYRAPKALLDLTPEHTAACLDHLASIIVKVKPESFDEAPDVTHLINQVEELLQREKKSELQMQRDQFDRELQQLREKLVVQSELSTASLQKDLALKNQEADTLSAHLAGTQLTHETQIAELKAAHRLEIRQMRENHSAHNEEHAGMLHEQIRELKKNHEEVMLQTRDHFNQERQQMQQHVDKLISQSRTLCSAVTSSHTGQQGEAIISDLVKKVLQSRICTWEDMTRVEGAGDVRVEIMHHDERYVALIESKLVKNLHSKRDVEKFQRDVEQQKPDFALMISLRENSVQHGGYKREEIKGIPALTIQTSDEHVIGLCFDYLILQARAKRQMNTIKDASRYTEEIDLLFTGILDFEDSLRDREDIIKRQNASLNEDRRRIDDQKALMNSILAKFPRHSARSSMDLAVDEIKPGITRKADYTSNAQLEIFSKAGGFEKVKAEAKRRRVL